MELVRVWERLVADHDALLRAPLNVQDFAGALADIESRLLALLLPDPDKLLFVVMFAAATSTPHYSAAHTLRVGIASELAAAPLGAADPARLGLARRVALSMNIAMCAEQDCMATQSGALTPAQRELVDRHAEMGAEMLRGLGVADPDWLQAVTWHHAVNDDATADDRSGALPPGGPVREVLRLIQRADVLMAGFSRRGRRTALPANRAAGRAFDQDGRRSDAAGAALIKALGIHPPGTLVRLESRETAIVRRRGSRADQPLALALLRPDGMPHLNPKPRDTSLSVYRIVGGLTPDQINLRLPVERLLACEV